MSHKHFIQLLLGSKTYKDQVSTAESSNVAEFKEEIKKKFFKYLSQYEAYELKLFEANGSTVIDPETLIKDLFITKGKPLVVKVEEVQSQKPTISFTRHQDYKQTKAISSCRSYLTSLALELEKIYPIVKEKSVTGRDKPVTFGTIISNAYRQNPKPFPQFKDKYPKLNAHFNVDEWNYLDTLNETVNGQLHLPLNPGEDVKYLILPSDFSGNDKISQRIAEKTNVVSEANDLIVKNEGSVSGGTPDSDKKL